MLQIISGMTRRSVIASISASAVATAFRADAQEVPAAVVARNDAAVESYLQSQITSPGEWAGSVPDEYLQHTAGAASGLIETLTASLNHSGSKHFHSNELVSRI